MCQLKNNRNITILLEYFDDLPEDDLISFRMLNRLLYAMELAVYESCIE